MNLIVAYVNSMRALPRTTWKHVVDEWREFIECFSKEELFDVIHVTIRWVTKSNWLGLIAWPTAKKHALRYIETGSARSKRHT